MAENERKEKDEEDRDIEMLKQRVELDMKVCPTGMQRVLCHGML